MDTAALKKHSYLGCHDELLTQVKLSYFTSMQCVVETSWSRCLPTVGVFN